MSHNDRQKKLISKTPSRLLLGLLVLYPVIALAAAVDTTNCGGVYGYTTGGPGKRATGSPFGHRDPPKLANGKYGSDQHQGVDIPMSNASDKNAYSTISGKVVAAYEEATDDGDGHGNFIIIESNGVRFQYSHIPKGMMNVHTGQDVKAGDIIANYNGLTTGGSTGAHIHYEAQVQTSTGAWVNVDPKIVEAAMTSPYLPMCPGTPGFNEAMITKTMTAHPLTKLHYVHTPIDPNSVNQSICAKKAAAVTPTPPAPVGP